MRRVRYWHAVLIYLSYQVGPRGYCWVCDELRWTWTHRSCGRRHHAAAAALAPLIAEWPNRSE